MRYILLFAVILIQGLALSQNNSFEGTIVRTESLKKGNSTGGVTLFYRDDEFAYCKREIQNKYYLEKYKLSDLTLVKSTMNHDFFYNSWSNVVKGYYGVGENVLVIYVNYDKKANKYAFYGRMIDTETMLLGEPQLIIERIVPEELKRMKDLFEPMTIVASPQENFRVLIHDEIPGTVTREEANKTKFNKQVILLDEKNGVSATSLFKLPGSGFSISQYHLSNEGKLFVMGFTPETYLDNQGKEQTRLKHQVVSFDCLTGKTSEVIIETKDHMVNSFSWLITDAGEIYLAGLSLSAYTNGGAKGCVLIKLSAGLEPVHNSFMDFDREFVMTNLPDDQRKEFEKDNTLTPVFSRFNVSRIMITSSGQVVAVAERYYYKTSTMTSNGVQSTQYTYYYEDLLVMNFDAQGEPGWKACVPKRQCSVNDPSYSSFFLFSADEKVNIVYTQPQAYLSSPRGENVPSKTMNDDQMTTLVQFNGNSTPATYRLNELDGFKIELASYRALKDGGLLFLQSNGQEERIVVVKAD